jgi:hypothetical protein
VAQYVFVTIPEDLLEEIIVDEDTLVDSGVTDRQGDSFLVLYYNDLARHILDDFLADRVLINYTAFSL